MVNKQFFEKIFENEEFIDRKVKNKDDPIDVIIPMINSNLLFKKNLLSFYREIPINRLIIGNAGITDNSLEIAKEFPRVKIIEQSQYISLGYCIAELISLVETEWFIYLHADVYLPENWYDSMKKYQKKYDWYECDRHSVSILEVPEPKLKDSERAYSGSQMGRKEAFKKIIPKIDDDYLLRNEDMIFQELIEAEGYKYGRIFDTFHYHQLMNKRGENEPKIDSINIHRTHRIEWGIKTHTMQVKGIIKYLKPKPYLIRNVNISLAGLRENNAIDIKEFKKWVKETNSIWLKYIKTRDSLISKMTLIILNKFKPIINKLINY